MSGGHKTKLNFIKLKAQLSKCARVPSSNMTEANIGCEYIQNI